MSDWFQFLFQNTVLSGRFTSVLINVLLRTFRVYPKSEENVDFTLHYCDIFLKPSWVVREDYPEEAIK